MELLEPWYSLERKEKKTLLKELKQELHKNHILYKTKFELIGRRCDRDDILLRFKDRDDLAIVHLTWKQSKESGKWPLTDFKSIEKFVKDMNVESSTM